MVNWAWAKEAESASTKDEGDQIYPLDHLIKNGAYYDLFRTLENDGLGQKPKPTSSTSTKDEVMVDP